MIQLLFNKKSQLVNYGSIALSALAVYLLIRFTGSTELTLTLVFLSLILLPGFLLSEIFKFKFKDDFSGNFAVATGLGFTLAFLVMLLGIAIKLTINDLGGVYIATIAGIFILALGLSLTKKQDKWLSLPKIKAFSQKQALLLYPALIVCFLALFSVGVIGGQFSYDAYFHLSIMRKAFDGQPLSLANLSFTDSSSLHIAYGVPIWHIFLSLIAKLARTNIFNVWAQIPLALTTLSLAIWYWLAKLILPGKKLALLAIICLIFAKFSFGSSEVGMFAMPEFFARMILLPLMLAIAIKFIYGDRYHWKLYGLLIVLTLFTGMIHWIQYFYYLTILGSFGIAYGLLGPKKDKIVIVKKIALTFFGSWPFIIGYILFLQDKSGQTYSFLRGHILPEAAFIHASYRYQWIYLLMLTALSYIFSRLYPKLLVLSGAFLALLVFNVHFIRDFSIRYLNETFWNRLEPNLNLDFLAWPLLIGTVFVVVDNFLDKKQLSKKVRGTLEQWFTQLHWPVLNFVLMTALIFALFVPDFLSSKNIFSSRQLNQLVGHLDATNQAINVSDFGGQASIDFLHSLPPKSVILADRFALIPLATLVDDYMADYADGEFLSDYQKIYAPVSVEEKKAILAKARIDYVLVMPGQADGGIDQNPNVFSKIYDSKAKVYRVLN